MPGNVFVAFCFKKTLLGSPAPALGKDVNNGLNVLQKSG
jgi:hypothetical protein